MSDYQHAALVLVRETLRLAKRTGLEMDTEVPDLDAWEREITEMAQAACLVVSEAGSQHVEPDYELFFRTLGIGVLIRGILIDLMLEEE